MWRRGYEVGALRGEVFDDVKVGISTCTALSCVCISLISRVLTVSRASNPGRGEGTT